ncbi:hypothetical protein NC651_020633 [Populus alba x Populus x berolinensis]|nr:hypothetical protein NC651_020633 [Populus alba x Populus x berolinensis]
MIKFSHVYDIKEFSESYVRLPVSHHTLLNVPDPSRASNSSPGKHLVPKESQDCFFSEAFLALQIDIYREEGCHPSSWKSRGAFGSGTCCCCGNWNWKRLRISVGWWRWRVGIGGKKSKHSRYFGHGVAG